MRSQSGYVGFCPCTPWVGTITEHYQLSNWVTSSNFFDRPINLVCIGSTDKKSHRKRSFQEFLKERERGWKGAVCIRNSSRFNWKVVNAVTFGINEVVMGRSLICNMAVTSASSSVHSWVKNKQNMFKMSQPEGVLQNGFPFYEINRRRVQHTDWHPR